MGEKTKLTLSVNRKVLARYKKHCEKEGLVISKQVENFMLNQLKRIK